MSLRTFVVLSALFVIGAFGSIFIYDPPVAGTYEGLAEDLPNGARGEIRLTLEESGGRLTGQLTLPPAMTEGGGALVGSLGKAQIAFVTTDAGGHKMTWTALRSPKCLTGLYWWGEIDEKRRTETEPLGRWVAAISNRAE